MASDLWFQWRKQRMQLKRYSNCQRQYDTYHLQGVIQHELPEPGDEDHSQHDHIIDHVVQKTQVADAQAEVTPKKGRGRPRKHPVKEVKNPRGNLQHLLYIDT